MFLEISVKQNTITQWPSPHSLQLDLLPFSLLRPHQRSQGVTEKVHKEEPTSVALPRCQENQYPQDAYHMDVDQNLRVQRADKICVVVVVVKTIQTIQTINNQSFSSVDLNTILTHGPMPTGSICLSPTQRCQLGLPGPFSLLSIVSCHDYARVVAWRASARFFQTRNANPDDYHPKWTNEMHRMECQWSGENKRGHDSWEALWMLCQVLIVIHQ